MSRFYVRIYAPTLSVSRFELVGILESLSFIQWNAELKLVFSVGELSFSPDTRSLYESQSLSNSFAPGTL